MEQLLLNQDMGKVEEMNEDTYQAFVVGLKEAIRLAGYKQEDFSEGIVNSVTLSKHLNFKQRMKDENIDKYAKKLNKSVSDIVMIGRDLLGSVPNGGAQAEKTDTAKEQLPTPVPGLQAGYIIPTDVLSAVSTLVGQYQKNDERMRFWRAIFDELPIPALIVKDGVVTYQNVKSSAWGNITGSSLCDSCACPEDCKQMDDCPIHQAMGTRNPISGFQHIGAGFYKVNITPVRLHDHEYFIIVATETDAQSVDNRRSGEDRRKSE